MMWTAVLGLGLLIAAPAVAQATDAGAWTLEVLLAHADEHAPDLAVARAEAERAEGAVAEAASRAPDNPEVGVAAGPRVAGARAGVAVEVEVSQRLEVAGEPRLRRAAARSARDAAAAGVGEARWRVHADVRARFADALVARARLTLAENNAEFAASLRDIAARQVEVGEVSPLVSLVAEADVAEALGKVELARGQYGDALVRLAVTAGIAPGTVSGVDGAMPEPVHGLSTDRLRVALGPDHPISVARAHAVTAASQGIELADRDARPEPTVGLSWEREPGIGPEPPADAVMLGLSIPIPVWRQNDGARAAAQAELTVAEAEEHRAAIELAASLEGAVVALNAAGRRVEIHATGVVPQLEANLELLRRAYELGEVDIHAVSQTRARLLAAGESYLDARADYAAARAELEGLLGAPLEAFLEERQ